MKNKKLLTALYIILMFLPLIAVVVAYPFLPDKIPAHYGIDNQVTRWGNKSETFIFPIITLFFGFFMYIAARGAAEQEKKGSGSEKNNSTITFVAGILSIMVFDILTFYFLYADFHQVENLNDMPFSLTKISFGVLGIALIILGNIMPKLKRNSIIGLRTRSQLGAHCSASAPSQKASRPSPSGVNPASVGANQWLRPWASSSM